MTDIYESPDKGETVYVRKFGSRIREEVQKTPDPRTSDGRPLHEHIMENKMWGEIRRLSKTNVPLADALDKVKMIYALIKKENN